MQQENEIPISFLNSERNSEKSLNNSKFVDGGFLDDQSSIHPQEQDTEMNIDDQIGFVVVVNENIALGVCIDTGQFIMFTYDNIKKTSSH